MTCKGLTIWVIERVSVILYHSPCLSTCFCMEEVKLWTGSRQLKGDKWTLQTVPGGRLPCPWSYPALSYEFCLKTEALPVSEEVFFLSQFVSSCTRRTKCSGAFTATSWYQPPFAHLMDKSWWSMLVVVPTGTFCDAAGYDDEKCNWGDEVDLNW